MDWERRGRCLTGLGVVLVALLVAGPDPARAQGNIEVGPFRILPSLEVSGQYNDNVLLAPRNEKSDFVWTISPGIAIELPGRRYAVRLGYRADILQFTDLTDLDTVHHTIQGDAKLGFPWGLNLSVSDEFRRTDDFAGFPVPELLNRIDRDENDFKAGVEYTVRERITVAVDYRFFFVDYRDAPIFDELDRQDQIIGLTLFYRILPKTSILGEYNYQIIRYDLDRVAQDRDSDANRLKLGVKGDLTAKTSVLLKAGYEWKDYISPAREDWTGLIVEGELIWKYAEPSQVRLFGGRANIESTFQDNNFFVAVYGGAEVRHHITPKLTLTVAGLGGVNDYPEPTTVGADINKKRSDKFYEASAALRYQIRRWLAVEASYYYLVRDSNFADFDYTNHRITATVRVTF